MKSLEMTGKTIDDAVQKGLEKFGVKKEEIDYKIIEQPSKGFLGIIGQKDAKVEIVLKDNPEKIGKEFISILCNKMSINVKVESSIVDSGYLKFEIFADNPGLLIGRRGETLDSIQYLTNLKVNKNVEERFRVIVDTENYREKREKTLIQLAHRLSEKVKRKKRRVILEPMAPNERRIIHNALQVDNDVKTYSEGEEPYRKVVIALKNNSR